MNDEFYTLRKELKNKYGFNSLGWESLVCARVNSEQELIDLALELSKFKGNTSNYTGG